MNIKSIMIYSALIKINPYLCIELCASQRAFTYYLSLPQNFTRQIETVISIIEARKMKLRELKYDGITAWTYLMF